MDIFIFQIVFYTDFVILNKHNVFPEKYNLDAKTISFAK